MAPPIGYRNLHQSDGVSYIREEEFNHVIAIHQSRGWLWKFDGTPTSYAPNKKLMFKNLDRLRFDTEDQFWTFIEDVKRAEMKPPTSLSGVFVACAKRERLSWRTYAPKAPFYGRMFGPWMEQIFRGGEYTAPVFLYDINQAYRWSGTVGLPDLNSAYRTRDFREPHAIYLVKNAKPYFPPPVDRETDGTFVMTSEERDAYQIDSADVVHGVAFRNERVDVQRVFDRIDTEFPSVAKAVSQSYWGIWSSPKSVQQIGMLSGSTRELRNIYYNPVWAAFVTGRVKIACWLKRDVTLRIYCDSIMSTAAIPTGTEPGEWKLVKEFKAGLRFHGIRYYPINPAEGRGPWANRPSREMVPF